VTEEDDMCAHYRRAMSYQGKVKWYVLLLSMNYLWKFLVPLEIAFDEFIVL
jgi:hypothetical protein